MKRAFGFALALALVGCATPQVRGVRIQALTLEDALSDHTTPHALIADASPFIVTPSGVGCATCALTGASLAISGAAEIGGTLTLGTDLDVTSGDIQASSVSATSVNAGAVSASAAVYVNTLQVPVIHGSGTVAQAIETGSGAANASGVKAVTFTTAFSVAPNCVCADTNAAPVACGISTAASTTAVTFTIGSARADTVQWHCIGAR